MEVHTIRGGSKEELESKKYNIGIGVSLGNKWFTIENILGLIQWSLEHSRDKVMMNVVDTIHAINIEVRRHRTSKEKALHIARRKGQELLEKVKGGAEKVFSPEERSRIIYSTWDDIADEAYKKKFSYLYRLYASDVEFRTCIISAVQRLISKEDRTFSKQAIDHLGRYLIEELPEMLACVPIKGVAYEAIVYPFDSVVNQLVEKIQQGELFPYIRENVIDTGPKVFLEVR